MTVYFIQREVVNTHVERHWWGTMTETRYNDGCIKREWYAFRGVLQLTTEHKDEGPRAAVHKDRP